MDSEIPQGLVKIDAPDTMQGYCLVEIGSDAHNSAPAPTKSDKPKK